MRVTFLVDSAFSADLSVDFNSASMFAFILFFTSFKLSSSSRAAFLFSPLLCSSFFLFSSSRYAWYLCLAKRALTRSSLVKNTLATPPTFRRWSLITLWEIKVCAAMFSTEISLLTENPCSTEACPCDRSRSFLLNSHKSLHSVTFVMPTVTHQQWKTSGLAEFSLANSLYCLMILSHLIIWNNPKRPIKMLQTPLLIATNFQRM